MEKEFLHIITENQGIIHKVCSIYCDSEEDRRDLFQEILVQLWKSFPSFRNESKFTTWMYRVALNTAITSFKKEKRQPDKTGIAYENLHLAEELYDTGKLGESLSRMTKDDPTVKVHTDEETKDTILSGMGD